MAFDLNKFLPLSAQANSSAPRFFTYETDDSYADITANDYFLTKINEIDTGDLLYAVCNDGEFLGVFEVSGGVVVLGSQPNGSNSKTVDEDYTVLETDTSLRVTGSRTITIPNGLPREVTIYAADSVVTLSVTPENQPNTIPSGLSFTLIWDETLSGYYVK